MKTAVEVNPEYVHGIVMVTVLPRVKTLQPLEIDGTTLRAIRQKIWDLATVESAPVIQQV